MRHKDKIYKIVDLQTGSRDTALDVKSLQHAINCSTRTAYTIANANGGRFKTFQVKALSVDEYVETLKTGERA